jgi:hypothetical protein
LRSRYLDTPSTTISNHRVLMKDVETEGGNDGEIARVSKHSNIKLDKVTTYVLASRDLFPQSKSTSPSFACR